MIATLWQGHEERINHERKRFIELVKSQNCIFEGGFFAVANHPKMDGYEDILFNKPISGAVYIEKTKLSNFVFNTPAVHSCHGWKLAEYLAMGKAIISTPLSNELPISLTHGENIHIVNNAEELNSAIALLKNDVDYRIRLEKNANLYYEEFVKPKAVIENLLNSIF